MAAGNSDAFDFAMRHCERHYDYNNFDSQMARDEEREESATQYELSRIQDEINKKKEEERKEEIKNPFHRYNFGKKMASDVISNSIQTAFNSKGNKVFSNHVNSDFGTLKQKLSDAIVSVLDAKEVFLSKKTQDHTQKEKLDYQENIFSKEETNFIELLRKNSGKNYLFGRERFIVKISDSLQRASDKCECTQEYMDKNKKDIIARLTKVSSLKN